MIQLRTIRRLWKLGRKQWTSYEPQDLRDDTRCVPQAFLFISHISQTGHQRGLQHTCRGRKACSLWPKGYKKGNPTEMGPQWGSPNPHSTSRAVAGQFTCRRSFGRALYLWALHPVAETIPGPTAPGLSGTVGGCQEKHLLAPAGSITRNEQEPQQCQNNKAYQGSENCQ